ncbi:hypothetical protein [Pandoraea iniqua]|uniref:hypothetical protein n=1 Tax=Pandoraea iniqua TaxID=2508288 RepID=UPI00123FD912|nr:hypothetical protein [Pandoraea iniqua]
MQKKTRSCITITQKPGRTRISVTGRFALPMLEALANGATPQAAAITAWLTTPPSAEQEAKA